MRKFFVLMLFVVAFGLASKGLADNNHAQETEILEIEAQAERIIAEVQGDDDLAYIERLVEEFDGLQPKSSGEQSGHSGRGSENRVTSLTSELR